MKQFFFAATLILLQLSAFSQSITPYPNDYYFGKEKIELKFEGKRLLVKFNQGMTDSQQLSILDNLNFDIDKIENLPAPVVTIVYLKNEIERKDLERILSQLKSHAQIEYASPFFSYDGTYQTVTREFIVKLNHLSDYYLLQQMASAKGATIKEANPMTAGLYVLEAGNSSNAITLANEFHKSEVFEYAEPNFIRIMKRYTTDPLFVSQWSLQNLGNSTYPGATVDADMDVTEAWATTTGSASIKIAVLDEGVDLSHPDLVNNLLSGYDATGLGSAGNASNDDAHGTACAGIIASQANNSIGTAGVAYGCKIIPVRIAYSNSSGNWVTSNTFIGNAITWAWQTANADVLSNSWGGGSSSTTINNAFLNAVNNGRGGLGAPVLVAAGNDNGAVSYPATLSYVIAVGAMSMCNQRKSPSSCDGETWWGSDYGVDLDIMAPGVKIAATDISGTAGYEAGDYLSDFNGTSSATPNAAGVMALILSANSALTEAQARVIIESTCEKVGGYAYATSASNPNGTWHNEMGYGRINANAAVAMAAGSCLSPSISASNITEASMDINIISSAGIYNIEYGTTGFSQGAGTYVGGHSLNTFSVSGLANGTTYDFYIQADCSGDSSIWVGPLTVTTLIPGLVTLGTGTTTNSTTTAGPVNIYYRSLSFQTVYTAAEITAANGSAGDITHLGWYVTQVPLYNMPNYTIKMKHTTATDAASHDGTGLTTVYTNVNYAPTAGGFDMLLLQTPFAWNGTDNLLIDICFEQTNPTYNSSGRTRTYSATNGARYVRSDDSNQCGVTTTTTQTVKPQVQFAFATPPPPPPPPTGDSCLITWTNLTNTVLKQGGRRLQKNVNVAGFSGAALSQNSLAKDDAGWVQMEVLRTDKRFVYGLAWNNTDADKSSIRFGVELHTNSIAYVCENGYRLYTIGTYAIGDIFKIEKSNGTVKYYHNGTLVYTSTKNPWGVYYADAAIQSTNGIVYEAYASFGCASAPASVANFNAINSVNSPQNFSDVAAYPNPFEDNITLNYAAYTDEIQSIELYNINGQHIRSIAISQDGQTTIDTSDLNSGLYIISINGVKHLKVVKM